MPPEEQSLHIGVIPDGNRRYARNHGISHKQAYTESTTNILNIIETARKNNLSDHSADVDEVSLYLLSEENFARGQNNLKAIWNALLYEPPRFGDRLCPEQVDIRWVATDDDPVPDHVAGSLEDLERRYNGEELQVNLLFSYSGKQAIAQACRRLSARSQPITSDTIFEELTLTNTIDQVIRTGDNPRRECLSGFPIWQATYAEFYHIEKNFPAVTIEDCRQALAHYQTLRRNKGQ